MKRLVPFVILALLAGLYGGYRFWLAHRPFEWSGTVEVRDITVGSRVGGRVKDVLVREGDRVKAGQVLVVLEPGDLLAQQAIAKAQKVQAEAALAKLETGARPEERAQARARAAQAQAALAETTAGARREQVAQARARVAAADSMVAQARLDAERAHKLAAAGAAGAAEVDLADTRLRTALADRDAAGQVLAELEAGARIEDRRQAVARADEARAAERLVTSGARVEDLTVARAQLDAARARVEQLDLAIAELEIRAPRDARVQSLSLRPGDLLTPNAPAATLLEDDQLFVRIYVPETVIGRVRVGQDVLISVDSFPGERFPGKVTFISEVGEYTPRNLQTADERADQVFAVRIEVAPGSARDRLRAGMAAFAHVER